MDFDRKIWGLRVTSGMWGAVWVLVWKPVWEERRKRGVASQKRAPAAPWGAVWAEVWGVVWGAVWAEVWVAAWVKMRDSARDEARAHCGPIFRARRTARGALLNVHSPKHAQNARGAPSPGILTKKS